MDVAEAPEDVSVGDVVTGGSLWDGVSAALERAPDFSQLQVHRLHLLAAREWRAQGRRVPAGMADEERLAALRTLLAPLLLARIRESCDGRILLMKGAEVSLSYPDAALRPYRDVDILVDDAPSVQRALLAAGFEAVGEPDAYYEGRHHLRPLISRDYPLLVEVHRRPEWPKWASPPPNDELFAGGEPSGLGVDGILAPRPVAHALLVAAHSWAEVPLRRALDVLDAAALAEQAEAEELAATARRWGIGGVWEVTEEAAAALFFGERTPSSMRIWARDLLQVRDRTVLENHVRRIISPFWVLPFHRALAVAGGAAVAEVRPTGDEPWTAKLDRARRALRNPLRRLADHDQGQEALAMTELKLRSEGLEWREIEDEVIAIDIRNSSYLSANGSGLVIWRELAEGTTRELLIERLVETFGVETDRAAADVDHFLADLRSRGLLEG